MLQRHRTGTSGSTLDVQPVGSAVRLVRVNGGRERSRRLMDLGLRVGQTVMVTHVRGRGLVVACDAGRVAVGHEMARHIAVEEAV